MIILGIETSCDDTGIAIIEAIPARPAAREQRGEAGIPKFKIISNIVSSQVELHKKYGGVYPSLAKREHQKNLVPVLEQALKGGKLLEKNSKSEARWTRKGLPGGLHPKQSNPTGSLALRTIQQNSKFKILNSVLEREPELLKQLKIFLKKYEKPNVDLIAVTNGPGLEPCLWVGINFAKALAWAWDLPIVPINHIEAHILANFVGENSKLETRNSKQKLFPAICLIVSGGHTQLILMKDFGKYKIIGETRDDAAGECFDKTARILGLGYPGGPAIAAAAAKFTETRSLQACRDRVSVKLPRPMIHQKNYDFSFSGLKTAVLYEYKKQPPKIQKSEKYVQEMAKEIQRAIIDVLIKKTIKAAKDFKVKSIILSGGVAANDELRKQLLSNVKCPPRLARESGGAGQMSNVKFLVPPKILCTDNAAMTAVTGYFHKPEKLESIGAEANLRL